MWTNIVPLYQEDSGRQLRRTKLTSEHIYLSPQSVMRVYLAAQVGINLVHVLIFALPALHSIFCNLAMFLLYILQVLSHSVGSVMQTFGDPDCHETAKFVLLMDKFFDCLNVRYMY